MATMREVQSNWTEITNRLLHDKGEMLQFLRFSANLYKLPFSNAALFFPLAYPPALHLIVFAYNLQSFLPKKAEDCKCIPLPFFIFSKMHSDYRYFIGSTLVPLTRTSKCRWKPVENL